MSGHPLRDPALPPTIRVLLGSIALALAAATPSYAQMGWEPVDLGTPDRLTLRRVGTFEVWSDSTRLGTEFYREWVTPQRDSVIATSSVRYEMRGGGGAYLYQKTSVAVERALDRYPILYQSVDEFGDRHVATRARLVDTTLTVFHEEGGGGRGQAIEVPAGRLAVLDVRAYQQIESLASEFRDQQIPDRLQNVFLPQQDTIVRVRLVRGPRETRTVAEWGQSAADRIDVIDDWSVIQAWIDERGRMIEMRAPSSGLRVLRLPPGEREAQAADLSKGPPLPGNPPPPHQR